MTTSDKAKLLFVAAAGISFLFSVSLWFSGQREEGLFVGLWVPSILSARFSALREPGQDRLMGTFAIFVLGIIVTGITLTAVVLIGLDEARDPAHSKLGDLSPFE